MWQPQSTGGEHNCVQLPALDLGLMGQATQLPCASVSLTAKWYLPYMVVVQTDERMSIKLSVQGQPHSDT